MNNTVANSFLPRYARLGSRKKQRSRDARASKYKKVSVIESLKHGNIDSFLHQTKSTGAHVRKNIAKAVPHVTDKRLTLRGTVSTSPHSRGELMYKAKKKQSRQDLTNLLASAKGHKSRKNYGVKQSYRPFDETSDSSSNPDDLVPNENESLSSHPSLNNANNTDFLANEEQVFRKQYLKNLHNANSKRLTSQSFQPVRSPQPQLPARNVEFKLSDSCDEFSIPDGHTSPQITEKATHLAHSDNCSRSLDKNFGSPEFPHRKRPEDLSLTDKSAASITNQIPFSTYLDFTISIADYLRLETKKMFPGDSYFTEVKNSLQAISRREQIKNSGSGMIHNYVTENLEQGDNCFLGASGGRNGICLDLFNQPENCPESNILNSQDSISTTEGCEFGSMKNKANNMSTEHLEAGGDVLRLKRLGEMKVDAWLSASNFASRNLVDSNEFTSATKEQDRKRGFSPLINHKRQMKLGSPNYKEQKTSPEIINKKQFTALKSISPQNEIDITSCKVTQHTSSTHFLQNAQFLNSFKDMRQSATSYVPTSLEFLERTLGKSSKKISGTQQNEPQKIEGILDRNDWNSLHNIVNGEIKYSSQGSGRNWTLKTSHSDGGFLSSQRSMDFSVLSSKHLEMSNSLSICEDEILGYGAKRLQSDINDCGQSSSSNGDETLLELMDIRPAQQAIQDNVLKEHSDPKNLPVYKMYRRKMF